MAALLQPSRTAPTQWLVCHGDSITYGYGTTNYATKPFCELIAASIGGAFAEVNFGINGQGFNYVYPDYNAITGTTSARLGNLTSDAVTRVDPILAKSGTKKMVILGGTNDIFLNSASGTTTAALLQTYIDARISAGWTAANICVCTMLPRQGAHESDRTTLNTDINSKAATKHYVVADLAANGTIGAAGSENNATYYLDTVHPTDAGHVIIAGIIQAVLYP